jgi:hypothetical protein
MPPSTRRSKTPTGKIYGTSPTLRNLIRKDGWNVDNVLASRRGRPFGQPSAAARRGVDMIYGVGARASASNMNRKQAKRQAKAAMKGRRDWLRPSS